MIKPLDSLTLDVYAKYGNRKVLGRVSFFVDIKSGNVFGVPNDIEHIKYAPKISADYGIPYEKLIPCHIDTNGVEVIGVSTGYSGLEQKMNVRHAEEDLNKAHEIIWNFVKNGQIPVGKISENSIASRYAKR